MLITRVYTGHDGQTHFQDLETDNHPAIDSLSKVTSIRFRIGEPGNFSDKAPGVPAELHNHPIGRRGTGYR